MSKSKTQFKRLPTKEEVENASPVQLAEWLTEFGLGHKGKRSFLKERLLAYIEEKNREEKAKEKRDKEERDKEDKEKERAIGTKVPEEIQGPSKPPSRGEIEAADAATLTKWCLEFGLRPKGKTSILRKKLIETIESVEPQESLVEKEAAEMPAGIVEKETSQAEAAVEPKRTLEDETESESPALPLPEEREPEGKEEESLPSPYLATPQPPPSPEPPAPSELDTALHTANLLMNLGKYDQVVSTCDEALEKYPKSKELRLASANALFMLDEEKGMEAYDELTKRHPNFIEAWLNKEAALYAAGQFEEALQCLNQVLAANPADVTAWIRRGAAMRELGRYGGAVQCFTSALKINNRLEQVWNAMGVSLMKMNKPSKALEAFEYAVRIRKDYAIAWSNKGLALEMMDLLDEAIKSFDSAISSDETLSDAWNNKGTVLYKMARFDEAAECFEEAYEAAGDDDDYKALVLNNKGFSHLNEDKLHEALKGFEQALKHKPEFPEALNNMAIAYGRMDRLDEALTHVKKAIDLSPEFSDALDNLTRIEESIKKREGDVEKKEEPSLGDEGTVHEKDDSHEIDDDHEKDEEEHKDQDYEVQDYEDQDYDKEEGEERAGLDAEFKCPQCASLGSISDKECDSCGLHFTQDMKEGVHEDERGVIAALTKIDGVGKAKAKTIYRAGFKNVEMIKNATVKDLSSVRGVSDKLARKIKKAVR